MTLRYNPFAFDPKVLDENCVHSAPYLTTCLKNKLVVTHSDPEIRGKFSVSVSAGATSVHSKGHRSLTH